MRRMCREVAVTSDHRAERQQHVLRSLIILAHKQPLYFSGTCGSVRLLRKALVRIMGYPKAGGGLGAVR